MALRCAVNAYPGARYGLVDRVFGRYRPVGGAVLTGPHIDHNPLDRRLHLWCVERRI